MSRYVSSVTAWMKASGGATDLGVGSLARMRPEERQLIARLAHGADPREPCYDKERPGDVAWPAYISARRHIDAGRVGEERLAYLIWQIAEVTLRNRRLEGAVVTDQRPVRCLLAQTPIVCSSSSTLTPPEHLAELRRMPLESSDRPKERTRLVG